LISTPPAARGPVAALAIGNAILGMAIGLLVSAFAQSEFQAVQFMPAFVLPQLLLCGLIWPREQMAGWLEKISNVLPMTYAVDALIQVRQYADLTATMWRDVAVVVGCILVALLLGAATLRRRTALTARQRGEMARTGRRPGNTDTRESILMAAREAFAERGFDATSIRQIAAGAGVDPALVHHYFGAKDQLFVAAMNLRSIPPSSYPR